MKFARPEEDGPLGMLKIVEMTVVVRYPVPLQCPGGHEAQGFCPTSSERDGASHQQAQHGISIAIGISTKSRVRPVIRVCHRAFWYRNLRDGDSDTSFVL